MKIVDKKSQELKMPANAAEAINACVILRFNCQKATYALQSLEAIFDNSNSLKLIKNRGEFWGRVQHSFFDQVIVTVIKIFDQSESHSKDTFYELRNYARSVNISFNDLSDTEDKFIGRVKAYRNKSVAHQERIDEDCFVSLVGDDFWRDALKEMPGIIGKSLALCRLVSAQYGIALETEPLHNGYKDTVRWMNLE